MRANTPDLLVCVMHDQNSLLIARQMVATNTNVKLLFQGLGPQLASFREALGKYSELSLCSTYWDENVPYKDKFFGDSKKFVEYYKSKFTRPIAYHVAGAAACIETYILAMQAAKSIKPEAVRDALAAADYETFYSRIKFTPEGDGDRAADGRHDRPGPEGQARDRVPGGRRLGQADLSGADLGQEGVSCAIRARSRA